MADSQAQSGRSARIESQPRPVRVSPYDLVWRLVAAVSAAPLGHFFVIAGLAMLIVGGLATRSAPVNPTQRRYVSQRESALRTGDTLMTAGGFVLISGSILIAGSQRRKD